MNRAERRAAKKGAKDVVRAQVKSVEENKAVVALRYVNVISNMKEEDIPIEKAKNGCGKCYGRGFEGKRDDGTVAVCPCVANKIKRGIAREVTDEKAKPEATKA